AFGGPGGLDPGASPRNWHPPGSAGLRAEQGVRGEPGASAPGGNADAPVMSNSLRGLTPPARLLPEAPVLKAIQLHNAYLVLETAEGMLVIDQHALHERILFEQLKRRIRSGTLEVQPLLLPEPVEFTAEQAA